MSDLSKNSMPEMVETYRHFLKTIPIFAECSDHTLDYLLQNLIEKKYEKGKLLFLSGDAIDYFYIVEKGWVKLFRETRDGHEGILSLLTHGDVFGEAALLEEHDYPYSCEIIDNATLLQIPISHIRKMAQLTEHCSLFCEKLLTTQVHVINQKCLEVEHLTTMTSAQRIGCFLLKHCGQQHKGSITLQFPVEKYLLAGRLGMTPETFSRALNQLSALGVVSKNSEVIINNIEQLKSHVCQCCSALAKECDFLDDEFETDD